MRVGGLFVRANAHAHASTRAFACVAMDGSADVLCAHANSATCGVEKKSLWEGIVIEYEHLQLHQH